MNGCGDTSFNQSQTLTPTPKTIQNSGGKCFPSQTCRTSFDLPQSPNFIVDHKEPIVVEWPPENTVPECEIDTGPRPDLLAQIPDQIVPQVVTMMATPTFANPNSSGTISPQTLQHPLCPDGQLHMRIDPTKKPTMEFWMPQVEPSVRRPVRPWIQCVENALITDQVRRPLARCCHKCPLPPLVIPQTKLQEMILKTTEKERKRQEIQQWYQERECQRLRARERQGKWNYTVESLLDRKRQKELGKEEEEKEATRQLMEEVNKEKKAQSDAQIAKAKQLMLHRKGLIRDFHSALRYSKMMQEIEQMKSKPGQNDDSDFPQFLQKCTKKMMYPNESRADYKVQEKEKKPINQKLLERLKCVEKREIEQQAEINNELLCMKKMIAENLPDLPEPYKKYIAIPPCDDDKKENQQQDRRYELYESISDKLAADAYIESYENEIERQACEFNEYKRQVDAIRNAKEKKLIDDKVAFNIAKSDAAARVLVRVQQKKQGRANEYDALREKWVSEREDKIQEQKKVRDRIMQKVVADFNNRKCAEGWKRCELDPARQWAWERLVAVENFEKECEQKSDQRKKAEDIALFNIAQVSAKHCRDQRTHYMNDVWAAKMKQEYLDEMKEMKAYAHECMEDWKEKGRSTFPMEHAMKKWDYDAGMYPYLFAEGNSYLDQQMKNRVLKSDKNSNCPKETTSKRLGFFSGGC